MKKPKTPPRLSFFWADDFFNLLLNYRTLWIQGRYGGGKTSLAVILAAWLRVNGKSKRVVANFDTFISEPIPKHGYLYDAAIIIDETHAFISDRASVNQYAKFLRKTDYYLLMPSVMPPHPRLTSFAVQRVFNGYIYGLPLWVYKYTLRSGNIRESGYFAVIRPHLVFGSYDTKNIPSDDGGISDAIDLTIELEKTADQLKKKGHKDLADRLSQAYRAEIPDISALSEAVEKLIKEKKPHAKNSPPPASRRSHSTNSTQDIQDTMDDAVEQIDIGIQEVTRAARKIRRR